MTVSSCPSPSSFETLSTCTSAPSLYSLIWMSSFSLYYENWAKSNVLWEDLIFLSLSAKFKTADHFHLLGSCDSTFFLSILHLLHNCSPRPSPSPLQCPPWQSHLITWFPQSPMWGELLKHSSCSHSLSWAPHFCLPTGHLQTEAPMALQTPVDANKPGIPLPSSTAMLLSIQPQSLSVVSLLWFAFHLTHLPGSFNSDTSIVLIHAPSSLYLCHGSSSNPHYLMPRGL